jgi:hypothetical protein
MGGKALKSTKIESEWVSTWESFWIEILWRPWLFTLWAHQDLIPKAFGYKMPWVDGVEPASQCLESGLLACDALPPMAITQTLFISEPSVPCPGTFNVWALAENKKPL